MEQLPTLASGTLSMSCKYAFNDTVVHFIPVKLLPENGSLNLKYVSKFSAL